MTLSEDSSDMSWADGAAAAGGRAGRRRPSKRSMRASLLLRNLQLKAPTAACVCFGATSELRKQKPCALMRSRDRSLLPALV